MATAFPGTRPLLFTVEFRRKMASLTQSQRREWLASLAPRARSGEAHATQELREVARGCRLTLVDHVERELGPFDPLHLRALLEVPRERFVHPDDIERSADDTPLPLDSVGLATVSAPHAYLLSFRLLDLGLGDSLVELGTGSGYGAALASYIVGPKGRVRSFEIDRSLAQWAIRNLADVPNVVVSQADAEITAPAWEGASKIVVTFAIEELPQAWLDAIPEGGRLVAPVGRPDQDQRLVLVTRLAGELVRTEHGAVRYVANRSAR